MISFKLSKEAQARVGRLARARGYSASALAREALLQLLDDMEDAIDCEKAHKEPGISWKKLKLQWKADGLL
jgi:predicted transcriptional regulator